MLKFKHGNLLTEDAQALVNPVNCVGVMGRGLALQFKKAHPDNFRAYADACATGTVQPGHMFVFETSGSSNPQYIINFPTKRHWRHKSRMEDIDAGLQALVDEIRHRHIQSIAIPALGSGLGGLEWSAVRPRIEEALRDLDNLNATIFEPGAAPRTSMDKPKPAKMTPA